MVYFNKIVMASLLLISTACTAGDTKYPILSFKDQISAISMQKQIENVWNECDCDSMLLRFRLGDYLYAPKPLIGLESIYLRIEKRGSLFAKLINADSNYSVDYYKKNAQRIDVGSIHVDSSSSVFVYPDSSAKVEDVEAFLLDPKLNAKGYNIVLHQLFGSHQLKLKDGRIKK